MESWLKSPLKQKCGGQLSIKKQHSLALPRAVPLAACPFSSPTVMCSSYTPAAVAV